MKAPQKNSNTRSHSRKSPGFSWRESASSLGSYLAYTLRLRSRYLFNSSGKLRLRSTTSPLAAVLVAGIAISSVMHTSADGSYQVAEISADEVYTAYENEPASGEEAQASSPVLASLGAAGQMMSDEIRNALGSNDSHSQDVTEAEADEPTGPVEKVIEIGKGDTLASVLQEAGLSSQETHDTIALMSDHYDPRKLKPGQKIAVRFEPSEEQSGAYRFSGLRVGLSKIKDLLISHDNAKDDLIASMEERKVLRKPIAGKAVISNSVYGSAAQAGIPADIVGQAIRAYSWDVDFQRDIREGDKIEVLYDAYVTEDGDVVDYGDLLYANLNVGGQDVPIYRYETSGGDVGYYEATGKSIRKALMRTPIDGARISSGFGVRRHPVLGYNKMHKGVDFAAPTGTPIFAAGDGTVEKAGRFSSYGNYVRIRHNSSMRTAYAHMSRFAKGVRPGSRVRQGQVIGYVGTTGRSTGAHLHFEVLMNGSQVNPNTVKMAQGDVLKGREFDRFKARMAEFKQQYAALAVGAKFAQR